MLLNHVQAHLTPCSLFHAAEALLCTDGGTDLQQKRKAYKGAVLAAHGPTVDDHLTVCNLSHLVCCSIIDHCLVQLHKQPLHPVHYAAGAVSVHSTGIKLSAFCLACRGSRQGLTWLPRMPCWSCKMLT